MVFTEQSWKSVFREEGLYPTPEEHRKTPHFDFSKKTVTILRQSLHGKNLFNHVSNSCFVGCKQKEIELKS